MSVSFSEIISPSITGGTSIISQAVKRIRIPSGVSDSTIALKWVLGVPDAKARRYKLNLCRSALKFNGVTIKAQKHSAQKN